MYISEFYIEGLWGVKGFEMEKYPPRSEYCGWYQWCW